MFVYIYMQILLFLGFFSKERDEMKIISILNNSALLAKDEKNEEFVLIGKGISFQKHPNDIVDMSKVEKKFGNNTKIAQQFYELVNDIPEKYFDITCSIIRYANKKLDKPLNKSIYITLFDHINSAIERYQDRVHLDFAMTSEISILYEKEYHVAEWALEYLNMTLDIELPEDECGFITMHFINAANNEGDMTNTKRVMRIAKEISNIVQEHYHIEITTNTMDYSRFLTHLKYFAIRYLSGKQIEEKDDINFSFSDQALEKCTPCLHKIDAYLKQKYDSSMQEDERNYLTLHLCRLIHIN